MDKKVRFIHSSISRTDTVNSTKGGRDDRLGSWPMAIYNACIMMIISNYHRWPISATYKSILWQSGRIGAAVVFSAAQRDRA